MATSASTGATRTWQQYLRESAVSRAVIDAFVQRPHWAAFDPELGYVLHNCLVPWGDDGSRTIETFRPDGARSRFDRPKVERLAEALDFAFSRDAGSDQRRQAAMLLNRYGQRATTFILAKASAFTQGTAKTLLVALNYTARNDHFRGAAGLWDGMRRDQEILDHLGAAGIPLFDMNAVHQREYERAGGSFHQYMSQYMVDGDGHYNPRGNHFFAYSLKDKLLELLDPKPLPYQDLGGRR